MNIIETVDHQFSDTKHPADVILLLLYQVQRHLAGRIKVLEWQLGRQGKAPFVALVECRDARS